MIIQVIGLPGTGKSYAINDYLKKNQNVKYLDIADYQSITKTRYKHIKHDIIKYTKNKQKVIVESACGININNSIVIKYKKDKKLVFENLLKRDGKLDYDYLSLLNSNQKHSKYTVSDIKSLHALFDYFLHKKV